MRTILIPVAMVAAIGCVNLREAQQVDMVQARVMRIDTVYRHPAPLKQLTWKDNHEIEYISYVSLRNNTFTVGSSMYVMRKR